MSPPAQPAAKAHADVRLMRWFAFAGAGSIAVFSIAMALVLGEFLASRMLTRDAEVSREFVQSIVITQQVSRAFRQPGETNAQAFQEFVAHMTVMPGVLRANVYGADRSVLWSSDPGLIGRRFSDNEELEAALAGQVVVHSAQGPGGSPDKAELQSMRGRSDNYVENYLPVYADGGGMPIGVVELYRNPVALFDAIRSGQRLVWWSAVAGGAFLFGTLMWFVRRAERALREQRARLVEAEALAIVGELSAAVAHSIRNPLGSIRSSAELQRELQPQTAAAMDDIMRGVDRIDRLVSTLLSYAAEPADAAGHATRADVDAVLAGARQRFQAELAAQGKRFECHAEPGLGSVAADPVLLAQVLNSLLANAAEATEAGDTISLHARRASTRAGAWVQIELLDSGKGIADTSVDQLFKPFYTTKPRGLGMGLALVRRVVLRLGGRIELQPQGARGTRVSVELPVR